MKQKCELILASGSPRRAELLNQIGVRYSVLVSDIDEAYLQNERPVDHVQRLAREKAAAGLKLSGRQLAVLGADTIVLLDGKVLGKPRDRSHAEQMLSRLSGHTHEVLSAVAVLDVRGALHETLNRTAVTFGLIPGEFIRDYCQTDDPMDKAGAYAVQGETARYISHVEGSYSGVMGLPLYETGRLLEEAGVIE